MNINNKIFETWSHGQTAQIAELEETLQEVDSEYEKLLQVRQNVLTEIDSLKKRVRLMVRSALASELPK